MKIFCDNEISWCLEVSRPCTDSSIFPLFEQGFQWVQKNFCGSFSSMLIRLAGGSGPSDLTTKIARIRHAVGEDVKQVWQEEMANCSTILLKKRLVYMLVFWTLMLRARSWRIHTTPGWKYWVRQGMEWSVIWPKGVNVEAASCDHDLEKRVCDLELELVIKRTKKIKGRQ